MKRLALAVGLSLAACGDEDALTYPPLQLDVRVTGGIRLTAIEVERPALCNVQRFMRPGACVTDADVVMCEGGAEPTSWIEEVTLTSAGAEVVTSPFTYVRGATFSTADVTGKPDLALVLYTVDNLAVTVPIAAVAAPPEPTITGATYDGTTVDITWTATPPAASAELGVSGGAAGRRCHVAAGGDESLAWPGPVTAGTQVGVNAFAPPATVVTTLGTAMVWTGGGGFAPLDPPTAPAAR